MYEAEFQYLGMIFAALFDVEDGMPKNLRIFTYDNDAVEYPGPVLMHEAAAAAARFIVDNNLTGA